MCSMGTHQQQQWGNEMNRKQRERERELWDNWEREQMERPRTAPRPRTPRTPRTTHRYETLIVLDAPDGITHWMRM